MEQNAIIALNVTFCMKHFKNSLDQKEKKLDCMFLRAYLFLFRYKTQITYIADKFPLECIANGTEYDGLTNFDRNGDECIPWEIFFNVNSITNGSSIHSVIEFHSFLDFTITELGNKCR